MAKLYEQEWETLSLLRDTQQEVDLIARALGMETGVTQAMVFVLSAEEVEQRLHTRIYAGEMDSDDFLYLRALIERQTAAQSEAIKARASQYSEVIQRVIQRRFRY